MRIVAKGDSCELLDGLLSGSLECVTGLYRLHADGAAVGLLVRL